MTISRLRPPEGNLSQHVERLSAKCIGMQKEADHGYVLAERNLERVRWSSIVTPIKKKPLVNPFAIQQGRDSDGERNDPTSPTTRRVPLDRQ